MSGGLSGIVPGGFGGGAPMPAGQVAPPAPELDPEILSATAMQRDDGGVDLMLPQDPEPADVRTLPHDANLAEVLPEQVLNRIAQEVIEGFEADVESNAETYQIFSEGMKLLALKPGERKTDPFDGASGAVHTLMKEAIVRYAAEASGELIPAAGPARCQVIGDSTPAKESAANRKQDWLNYYLTEADAGYAEDFDRMLPQVGLYGSMYRRVWRDPLRKGQPTSRYLSPFDLVTAATTTALNSGERATHVEPTPTADVIRLQLKGWYRDVDLGMPTDSVLPWKQTVDYRKPSDRPEDERHVLLHQYVLLDLDGFEHVDDDGRATGLMLPYIVTVDRETQKVLRLSRDWEQDDKEFARRATFVAYDYMPGMGSFLGWGFIHLVGATTDDLSVLRRQAIDAFSFASFPGGLRVKGGVRSENSDISVGPGEFVEVDTGGLPIAAAVMTLPYRDVPPSYPEIVEDITGNGQRLASIGDAAVGDGREDSLPGTVIALINQATKLQSSVIKRQHRAQRQELRLLADLFGRDPDATYPYVVNGRAGQAASADFADNADVLPVSDPNVPTQTHRLSLAQGIYTMAQSSNGMVDVREAARDFLRALGKSDADIARLMPGPQQGTPADPVTEFAAVLKGMPLAAGPAQDHAAHIQAHMVQIGAPGVQSTPAGPALIAHMADHLAAFYRVQVAKLTGIQVQPGQPLPPAQENQVATAVAAASDAMRQQLAQIMPQGAGGPGAADPGQMAELALKKLELQIKESDSERKAEASARAEEAEMIRQQLTLTNDRATRATELLTGLMDLEAARLKAVGDVGQSAIDAAGQQSEAMSAAAVAQHDAAAGHTRAVADIHGAHVGAAASGTQSAADVITAMAEHATAAAERDAAQAQAETQAASNQQEKGAQ